jgi:hypothetical protein
MTKTPFVLAAILAATTAIAAFPGIITVSTASLANDTAVTRFADAGISSTDRPDYQTPFEVLTHRNVRVSDAGVSSTDRPDYQTPLEVLLNKNAQVADAGVSSTDRPDYQTPLEVLLHTNNIG